MNYDIIGDIHGQSEKLKTLLEQLGYVQIDGVYQHPTRKAFFVGDLVDRGPGQIETLVIVKAMVDAGHAFAVLGNHEFNAIAFHTPRQDGGHWRQRNAKNRHQHEHFLQEVGEDSAEHQYWIDWFLTLPLWWENEHLRVVHACWHPEHMQAMETLLNPDKTLNLDVVAVASQKDHFAYESLEVLCKGLEVDLPLGVAFTDQQGIERRRTRIKWWDSEAITYRTSVLLPSDVADQLPDNPIPRHARLEYDGEKPLFFGHYWMTGEPQILAPNICCVDYSAAIGDHPLVAYRFDGEKELSPSKFVVSTPLASKSKIRAL